MKYVFINRFFHPDQSATSIMLGDLLDGLTVDASQILVITSAGGQVPGDEVVREKFEKIEVIRLPALQKRGKSLLLRVFDFALFYMGVVAAGISRFRRGDTVICLTDPPLVSIPVVAVASLKGARVINWLQDIYPETATLLGYGSPVNPVIRLMTKLRNRSWRNAHTSVCIGQRMARKVEAAGVGPEQIRIIPNWADESALTPLPTGECRLRAAWGFSDESVIIGYSGNLGRAHDLDTMLEAGRRLIRAGESQLQFLFVGGGAKHASLPAAATEPWIASHFQVRSYRPRAELRASLSVVDIHWLSLEPQLEGLIVPSKFYGAIAVGRPIIFIGDTEGEIADIIREAKCGASFAKGDVDGLAAYIRRLAKDDAMRMTLGRNGRDYCVRRLGKGSRIREWNELLGSVSNGSRRCATPQA